MTQTQKLTIEDISNKLKPILGSKIDELYFRYTLSESLEEKNEILHVLAALYQKHLGKFLDQKVLLEPPKEALVSGEYPLSKVIYGEKELYDFSLQEKDWPRHVCISGMSGSGKTTLAFNVLNNFIKKEKPFLVFDWKKSFRPLVGADPSVMAFTVGNDAVSNLFKMNINKPPKGVAPKEWINVLCDLLTESFAVSFGVHKILLETLDEIFEGWGVYKGSKHYPNWQHVKRMLEMKAREASGRESTWYESALRIASVLTFGEFGKAINYDGKKSLSVEDLFDKKVIFELNSLGNIEKKFFAEYILTYIYKLKKSQQNKIDEGFNYAILVDEAHNIFLKNKTNFLSESVTDMVYREMREYGISLICLDQHISKLSDTVKGNSACQIAFQQQLPQDIMDISNLMQLNDKKEFFSKLPVGTAIVKLSERHNTPFLVRVPFADLRNESVTDDMIKNRMSCMVEGFEVQKNDKEFVEEITYSEAHGIIEVDDSNVPEDIKEVEVEIVLPEAKDLTENQKVLYTFTIDQLSQGRTLREIEQSLEEGLKDNYYTGSDVIKVINLALKGQFKSVNIDEDQLTEKEDKYSISGMINQYTEKPIESEQKSEIEVIKEELYNFMKYLNEEEKAFMKFLIENPKHILSTVDFYNKIGLSSRKGNIVKNDLMNKGLIEIKEEKNEKGWKKLIRLNNSYLQN